MLARLYKKVMYGSNSKLDKLLPCVFRTKTTKKEAIIEVGCAAQTTQGSSDLKIETYLCEWITSASEVL